MAKISAGSYDLNHWLYGGYEKDIITTIYGAPGTGKTNFVMLAVASQIKKGNKVIFIDTEGGFSSDRIKQILGENYKEALKNILILKPTNFKEQKEAFNELEKNLDNHVSLIVVDGMTMLYRLDFAEAKQKSKEEIQKVNSELARQMKLLASIARKQNIPVLTTNQMYKWDDENRMVAGDTMQYWSKCIIELTNEKGRRTAYLKKHRSLPEKYLTFQIYDKGIRKKGWI